MEGRREQNQEEGWLESLYSRSITKEATGTDADEVKKRGEGERDAHDTEEVTRMR